MEPAELFERSLATLVRSWAYLASGSPGAELIEAEGVAIAAFVRAPDREFLNNAVLARGLGDPGAALDLVERTYAGRGIERYAVWAHERERPVAAAIEARGYAYDSSTRTMAMELADLVPVDRASLDLAEVGLAEFWTLAEVGGLAPELPPEGSRAYVARHEGVNAATLMAFDHDGDCGIYMVGTLPAARRHGLATALSAHALIEARARGCQTASLQSTPMAEGVYARVGFGDLGRFREFAPPISRPAAAGP